jgi:3-dehydroquinate synthase
MSSPDAAQPAAGLTVAVAAGGDAYDVRIGEGLLDRLGELCGPPRGQALVVCDANVAPLYLDRTLAALDATGWRPSSVVLPAGEQTKNPGALGSLYDRLYGLGVTRSDAVVALGGGVIGDLAGYAAATFLRGMRLVQVPTTILAMVDAAVGGKVAVDLREGKNYLGTFYQPSLVVEDLATLATLPAREVRSGWAEIVKHGLLAGGETLALTETGVAHAARPDPRLLEADVGFKATVVRRDPRETTGARAMLNFGHTIGHAIEVAGAFERYSHGEAVGLGLRAALWLSERLQGLDPGAAERGQRLLTAAGLPERLSGPGSDEVARLVARDKKVVAGEARFVLLADIGRPVTGVVVPSDVRRQAIAWLCDR